MGIPSSPPTRQSHPSLLQEDATTVINVNKSTKITTFDRCSTFNFSKRKEATLYGGCNLATFLGHYFIVAQIVRLIKHHIQSYMKR